ncbi:hypothetical protein BKA58DRAFT_23069 [Alternaria rosae]|uniref:uncharacterized protein n=1 Tax=Alternaria rosae TaxID=1187941 RepID=UPI001E8D1AE3|nr:uncharacterized protein BKA58DRAFT_23069 [Alternaria rosae]KAH6882682.1 hypothetical protein BKA58DRAFT_23069 [Alternaria rosae]
MPNMASSKATTAGFPDLPVEIRLHICSYIITFIPTMVWHTDRPDSDYPFSHLNHMKEVFVPQRIPSSHNLYSYHGLLLSCKTVYDEFEHEWLNAYIPWFKKEFDIHDFDLPTISKIEDTAHVRIGLPMPTGGWLQSPPMVHSSIHKLANILPSFCIYPISSLAFDHMSLTRDQIKSFKMVASGQEKTLFLRSIRLVAGVLTKLRTSVDTLQYGPIFGEDFQSIAMDWAWKEVVARREKIDGWQEMEWCDDAFRPGRPLQPLKTRRSYHQSSSSSQRRLSQDMAMPQ